MKKIVYIGNYSFPDGNAAGKRVYSNGYLLREMGYEVTYIGRNDNIDPSKEPVKNEFSRFTFYEINASKNKLKSIIFNNNRIYNQIIYCIQQIGMSDIESIILYGELATSLLNMKLLNFFRKNNIKVIIDCVEWWREEGGNLIFRMIKNFNTHFLMTKVNNRADGVITISQYLSDFYNQYKIPTVVIPPLVINKAPLVRNENKKNIRFVYAGYPFRLGIKNINPSIMKDRLDLSIKLLCMLKSSIEKLEFHIFGITKEEYLLGIPKDIKLLEENSSWIIFHGNTTNSNIEKFIEKSDFSILLRESKLVTKAGFSTKLVESISLGTPVLTTRVGDIDCYVTDKENGVIIDLAIIDQANQMDELIETILTTIDLFQEQYDRYNIFHYLNYNLKMEKFFYEVNSI